MVIGPFINASAVLLGGVLGALLSQRLPERIRVSMTSLSSGIAGDWYFTGGEMCQPSSDGSATLLGALIGEFFCWRKVSVQQSPKHKICFVTHVKRPHESFIQNSVAIIVLFLCQPTGISGR
ncbi:DUF554 family protein [Escherichia coli]